MGCTLPAIPERERANMNPRDRKLRLQKTTVRNLLPGNANRARGGYIILQTKDPSIEACRVSDAANHCLDTYVDCAEPTRLPTNCYDTEVYTCAGSCMGCDTMTECPETAEGC